VDAESSEMAAGSADVRVGASLAWGNGKPHANEQPCYEIIMPAVLDRPQAGVDELSGWSLLDGGATIAWQEPHEPQIVMDVKASVVPWVEDVMAQPQIAGFLQLALEDLASYLDDDYDLVLHWLSEDHQDEDGTLLVGVTSHQPDTDRCVAAFLADHWTQFSEVQGRVFMGAA
jgi:hypothetical protein